jgi:uncharacterized membrane protein
LGGAKAISRDGPVSMFGDQIHFSATHKIKHQMMLICINAIEKVLYLLIVISDPVTRDVFRNDVEEDI